MKDLAEDTDSEDKIIEVDGQVHHVCYTDSQGEATDKPNRTPIRDLDGLMAIPRLDPKTAEKICNDHLKTPGNPYSGRSVRG